MEISRYPSYLGSGRQVPSTSANGISIWPAVRLTDVRLTEIRLTEIRLTNVRLTEMDGA